MGIEFYQLSGDARRALEQFRQDFATALVQSDTEEWAKQNGVYVPSRALKTTWPIPVSAAGYHEFKGDMKYRSLFEKSISLMSKTWQDGVAELASTVEAPDFIGWGAEPAAMAAAQKSLLNEIIVTSLEANATHPYDAKTFFAADHPYNIFKVGLGTFDNDHAGAPSVANLKLANERFRAIKGANGKSLGLRLTHVLSPSVWEEEFRDMLEQAFIVQTDGASFAAVDNRNRGRAKLIVSDELTHATQWYALALNKPGMYPWVTQDEGTPEEIVSDKSSFLYQSTLKIGISYIMRANGGLALPQCIQRWSGV